MLHHTYYICDFVPEAEYIFSSSFLFFLKKRIAYIIQYTREPKVGESFYHMFTFTLYGRETRLHKTDKIRIVWYFSCATSYGYRCCSLRVSSPLNEMRELKVGKL